MTTAQRLVLTVALYEPLHEIPKISHRFSGETEGAPPARQLDPSDDNAGQGVWHFSDLLISDGFLI